MINEKFPDFERLPLTSKGIKYWSGAATGDTPCVTIITPFYNTGEIFYETYKCITNQSLQNFEWLIIDDGTTEKESLKVLEKIVAYNDPRIRIIHHEKNQGLPTARNTGIFNAKSDYLFFIDSDDLIELTSIETYLIFLCANPQFYFVNSHVIGFGYQHYFWRGYYDDKAMFFLENRATSSFMARKAAFKKIQFDPELRYGCEDWDFWLQAAANGLWGHTIPEFRFWYRTAPPKAIWSAINSENGLKEFSDRLIKKYKWQIEKNGFPNPKMENYNYKLDYDVYKYIKNPIIKHNKRLLVIIPWIQMGGADNYNINLIAGLVKEGWDITVVTTLQSTNEWLPEISKYITDIFCMPNIMSSHYYASFLDYIINSRFIDLVFISNSMYAYRILPYLKSKHPHLPCVDYLHSVDENWNAGGYPRISSHYSNFLTRTFVSSKNLSEWMNDKVSDSTKLEVCYINIDEQKVKRDNTRRAEMRREWGINDDYPIIIYAGRIAREKQPDVLVESIHRLRQKTEDFLCIIIGDGPEANFLKHKISSYNLEGKVWYMGGLPNDKVQSYFDAGDIFFLPSEYEGISLAIYEAMAKSMAIVSARVGGQAELVSGDVGFLVDRADKINEIERYSELLFQLVSNPEKVNTMGRKARLAVEQKFSLKKMISQMNDALSQLINNKSILKPCSNNDLINAYYHIIMQLQLTEEISNGIWSELQAINKNGNPIKDAAGLTPTEIYQLRDNYNKVIEWYHKQYEVLPLWYKQFGHIIKVFRGERNLKSLFEKNQN